MARVEEDPALGLITLDPTLEREDGLDIAREIQSRRNIAIIIITGRTTPVECDIGLEPMIVSRNLLT